MNLTNPVFPEVVYGCEIWTIKKAEHWRIDVAELWCWRRLLRVTWQARRSHQSIVKEISPEYSLEGLMLKLKLQYFGHLMQRADSLEKDYKAGKDWGQKKNGSPEDEMVREHHWHKDMNLSKVWEIKEDRGDWCAAVCGVAKSQTQCSVWTTVRLAHDHSSTIPIAVCGHPFLLVVTSP